MALYENGPLKIVGPNPEGKNPNMGLWSLENAGGINVCNDLTLHDAEFFQSAPILLEALLEARTDLSNTRTNIMTDLMKYGNERWDGVPEKLKQRLDAIDAVIAKALKLREAAELA